jgi:tetratricopeptide (TPR) repeat protein
MKSYRDIFAKIGIRFLFILPLLVMGWLSIPTGKVGWGGMQQILFAIVCFVAAAVIMGPLIAELFAKPAGSIHYSGEDAGSANPQPYYDIAEKYRAQGRSDAAMNEYKKIAWQFPKELKPHIDMIDIAVADLHDQDLAEEIFRKALSVIEDDKDRNTLKEMYDLSRTMPAEGKQF